MTNRVCCSTPFSIELRRPAGLGRGFTSPGFRMKWAPQVASSLDKDWAQALARPSGLLYRERRARPLIEAVRSVPSARQRGVNSVRS
jgi:hypothetical protein